MTDDQLSPVRELAAGDRFRITSADRAALKAVLQSYHEMRALLSTAVDAFDSRQFKSGVWHAIPLHRAWFDEARRFTQKLKDAAGKIQ